MIKYIFILLLFPKALFAQPQSDVEPVENSTDWRGLVNLAREAYKAKEYKKAMLFYQTAMPEVPEDVDLSNEIAQTQYRLKQYQAASDIYQKKSSGDNEEIARAQHNLGNIAMQGKNYKSAINHYKNALRKNPSNEKTRYNLSEAIRRQKEKDKENPPPPKDDKDKDKDKENQDSDKDDQKKDPNEKPDNQKNPSSLSDNSVERELDKLMRKEADTKRKVASSKEGKGGKKATKEW